MLFLKSSLYLLFYLRSSVTSFLGYCSSLRLSNFQITVIDLGSLTVILILQFLKYDFHFNFSLKCKCEIFVYYCSQQPQKLVFKGLSFQPVFSKTTITMYPEDFNNWLDCYICYNLLTM